MRGEDAFRVEGRVIEVLSDRTWRVELANGHRLLGFVLERTSKDFSGLKPGDKVKVKVRRGKETVEGETTLTRRGMP